MYGRAPRLTLTDLDSLEQLKAQFNPEELALGLKAVWNKQTVPGMSHTVRQFSHTDDLTLQFTLTFRVTDAQESIDPRVPSDPRYERFSIDDRYAAEQFLMSLVVPRGDATLIARNSPPSVLVEWPGFLSFEAIMLDVGYRYTRFNVEGQPTEFTAQLSMEELRDLRYTSLDARIQGFHRGVRSRVEDP